MNPVNPVDDPFEESASQSTESFGDILRQFEQEQAAAPAAKPADATGPIKGKVIGVT